MDGWAHVGRINLSSRMWVWQKQFSESVEQKLTTVTALAIDPQGMKIACYGYSATDTNSAIGYLFVLDTNSGAILSGLMKLDNNNVAFSVQSSSMIYQNDGRVYMANGTPPNSGS